MLRRANRDVPGANVGNMRTGEKEPHIPERLRAASAWGQAGESAEEQSGEASCHDYMPDCPACQAPLLIFLLGKNGKAFCWPQQNVRWEPFAWCRENGLPRGYQFREAAKMTMLRMPAERCWIKKRPPPLPPPQDHRPSLSPPASSPLFSLPPIPPITLYPLLSPYPTLSSMCSCGGSSGLLLYIIYIYILVLYSCLYYYISILVLYSNLYYTVW